MRGMTLYCLCRFIPLLLLAACSGLQQEKVRYHKRATVPGTVENVEVYVYYPIRNSKSSISALVVWESPDGSVPITNYIVQVYDSKGVKFANVSTRSDTTHALLETRSSLNEVIFILAMNSNYTLTVIATSSNGNGPSSNPESFSTYGSSPPQYLFAISNRRDSFTITKPNIQGPCPVAINTIRREVYWYSASKQLLRGYFNSDDMQDLVSPSLMANLTVLALAYDWVGERVYFAARAGGLFSLWRVPLINPKGLEIVFTGPPINGSSGVQLVMDPFVGYVYWSTQENGTTVLYQQDLRAVNRTIPTRRLDQSSTHIQLQAMTLDPSNGQLWVSDATTGNILSCNPMTWNCSLKVNATEVGMRNGLPATSIALDEVHLYWTRWNMSGIFYTNRNGPTTVQILSTGTPFAIYSTSPGQQSLPTPSCLTYDLLTRPVPYQVSATNTSILIGWSIPSLSAVCQSSVFSFPTLTYVVNVFQFEGKLPQYPAPGVITLDTTLTLDRSLSPFSFYNVQVAAYNQYTVSRQSFMFNATTGVVAFYGIPVTVMTMEGVPVAPQAVVATAIGAQAIFLSWNQADFRASTGLYYIQPIGLPSASSTFTNYTLRGLNLNKKYTISVIASNGVFNSTATMVTEMTWLPPPTPMLLNKTNTSAVVMINVTSVQQIIRIFSVKVLNRLYNNTNTSDPVLKIFTLTGLKAYTLYSISTVGTYVSNEIQESLPLIIQTGPGVPDAPTISISMNLLLWNDDVRSNDNSQITKFRLLVNKVEGHSRSEIIFINETIDHDYGKYVYDLNTLQLCTEGNESGIYNFILFAQNDIGESNGSNSITYADQSTCLTPPREAPLSIIAITAGLLATFAVCIIATLSVGCIVLVVSIKQKQAASEDVDVNSVRFSSTGNVAFNPQYSWTQGEHVIEFFPSQNLKVESFIDRGEFGEVYQGIATDILGVNTGALSVAVKTLRKGASTDEKDKFISEAALMKNLNNPYIVKILGVCIDADPICIVMELMSGGDLLHFLRGAKQDNGPALLTLKELIEISVDVAKGCCYLEQARFIHRDIAARNCLVSSKGADRVVKIGDFGLAKDLYSSDYYQVEGQRRLPVRWMAPEALLQGKFTLESDVWSYGVLLWEIMTLGNQPYPALTNQEVLQFILHGGRLDKPERCPKTIYQLMQRCWRENLSERLHFDKILDVLSNYLDHVNTMSDSSEDESDDDNVEGQGPLDLEFRSSQISSDRGVQMIFQGSQAESAEVQCNANYSSADTSANLEISDE